jgi:hypothetical protein
MLLLAFGSVSTPIASDINPEAGNWGYGARLSARSDHSASFTLRQLTLAEQCLSRFFVGVTDFLTLIE